MSNNNQKLDLTCLEESNDSICDNKCLQHIEQTKTNNKNENLNYKRLKKPDDFSNYSEYCLYLRTQLKKKIKSEEFIDGGLLLASHILTNERISKEFKTYIKKYVRLISMKMRTDIRSIEFNEIFDSFHLSSILTIKNKEYIDQRFCCDIYNDAIYEIERSINQPDLKLSTEEIQKQMKDDYDVRLLKAAEDPEINRIIDEARNYADLYELILDLIFTNDKNQEI